MYAYTIEHTNGRKATFLNNELATANAYAVFLKRFDIAAVRIVRQSDGHEMFAVRRPAKPAPKAKAFNISAKKVGGLRFFRIGRLCISACFTRKPV